MISLATLRDRITDMVPDLVSVTGVAALVAAKGVVKRQPACYIAPGEERAGGNEEVDGAVTQLHAETFVCWLAVANGASATGMDAQEDLAALSESLRAALIGWEPTPDYTPIELVSAGPVQWEDDQTLFWPELYRAHRIS
jgi:hypothetical protein